ncbi:MAG: AEC family transporter [Psychrosphaera sp.]|nr:AEC family transporter [Psychrosphaera sp.]
MNVFSIIFPVISVTALGYALARFEFLSKIQINGLSKLTFTLLMPAFLFVTMATTSISEVFNPKVIGAFYLPVLCFYALTMLYYYFFAKENARNISAAAVFAMGNTYSNVVLLGLPVTMAALGEAMAAHVFMVLSFHGIVMIGFTSFCGTFSSQDPTKRQDSLAKKLLKLASNPVLASIVGGMLYNVAGFTLHADLQASLRLMGKPGITLALIVLGSSLHYYSVKGKMGQIASLSLIKLVLLPFAMWLSATYVFDLSKELTAVVVILSASPTGINAYLVASEQKQLEALTASTVVVTTVLCMFTISGWLMFLL